MGLAKNWAIEQYERGWNYHDSFICVNCVESSALKTVILNNQHINKCTYCSSENGTTTFETLMNFLMNRIHEEYEDPTQHQPWENGEFVFNASFFSPGELMFEVGLECHADLWDDIVSSINQDKWVKRDFFNQTPYLIFKYAWTDFVDLVKYSSRYVFLNHLPSEEDRDLNNYDSINPIKILKIIQDGIIDHNLISCLKPGAKIYRARFHLPSERPQSAKELGTPPQNMSTLSNRMSPAGIPMFYGAINKKTAARETWSKQIIDHTLTIGEFTPTRSLKMVDLTKIPKNIDYFSYDYRTRHLIYFLNDFLKDFIKPITRDGREHIEYVPTQVVTEFLKLTPIANCRPFDGIIYPSHKTGKKACVIFATNEQCIDNIPRTPETSKCLKLISTSYYSLKKSPREASTKAKSPKSLGSP